MPALDRFTLDDKVCIVTGASSGLGVQVARDLAASGGRLVVTARRTALLERVAASIHDGGGECLAVTADVTDPDDCTRVVTAAVDRFGQVDVLVNNAGVASAVPALRETPAQFRSVVDLNLMGTFWMAQACARVMRPGSAIVNIGSALGITTAALPQAAYSASKAAVFGLTRDLAQQWTGRLGIRVNAVAPGSFRTDMTEVYREDYAEHLLRNRVLAGRFGEPEEVSSAVVFLAGDASSYVTGTVLPVDGGLSVT